MEYDLGLVLSGGGARGLGHVGVLQALTEEGIEPEVLAGTSAGAIVAALYALLVATARVYSGVHWPSDVLVGLLVGAGVARVIWWATPHVFGWIGRRRWVEPPAIDAPG